MVSIAEPFNYRIFERKRRLEEDTSGSTPSMPCLSVEQKPNRRFLISLGIFKKQILGLGTQEKTLFLHLGRVALFCTRLCGCDKEQTLLSSEKLKAKDKRGKGEGRSTRPPHLPPRLPSGPFL